MSKIWNKEVIELLLVQYKQHEHLYNSKHHDYQNRARRTKCLIEICERLKQVDAEITVESIKSKIHTLRSQFNSERRKISESEKSGTRGDNVYVSKLWFYPLMEFLTSHINCRQSPSTVFHNIKEYKDVKVEQEVEAETNSLSNSCHNLQVESLNEDVCRICLQQNGILNWNNKILKFCGMSYKDCYFKYTNLIENEAQCFPTNLCKSCANDLKNAHILFEKALQSFNFLQDTFTAKNHKTECIDAELCDEQDIANFEVHIFDESKSVVPAENEHLIELEDDKRFLIVHETESLEEKEILMTNTISEQITIENENFSDITKYEPYDENILDVNLTECRQAEVKPSLKTNTIKKRKKCKSLLETSLEEHAIREEYNTLPKSLTPIEATTKKKTNESIDKDCDYKTPLESPSTQPKKRKRKLYMCAYCSLQVVGTYKLKQHEATHNKERKRTETCPHCGIKLYDKLGLKDHIKIHDENRQKKYKCEFCEKAYYNRGALNIHRRIHLGLMVSCQICSKEFYRQIDLQKHLVTHSVTPVKKSVEQLKYTVQCQYCNKSVRTHKWKGHLAAHLNQPEVKCKICDKVFFHRYKCVEHLQNAHKSKNGYEKFIHYFNTGNIRMSHLRIQQQAKVQQLQK